MVRKILSIYKGISNDELYELAQICVDRCRADLRAVERGTNGMLNAIEELDGERNILRMPARSC